MAALVERATNDLLSSSDWELNLELCDSLNENPSLSGDVIKTLNKRLRNKNANVQVLTLVVLEMIIKNCGDFVHQAVAEKGILHNMVKIVKKKPDPIVRDKILMLLESWQGMFGGHKAKYPQYGAAYEGLRRSGVQFPTNNIVDTSLFINPAVHTTRMQPAETTLAAAQIVIASPEEAHGVPSWPHARLDDVLAASKNFVWSAKDLDGARQSFEVLKEMLNALDPKDMQAIHNDLILQMVEQCETHQKIIRKLVSSTTDENLLSQCLSLNDDLQHLMNKYHDLVSKSSGSTKDSPQNAGIPVTWECKKDETADELFHLADWSGSQKHRLLSSCNSQTSNGDSASNRVLRVLDVINPTTSAASTPDSVGYSSLSYVVTNISQFTSSEQAPSQSTHSDGLAGQQHHLVRPESQKPVHTNKYLADPLQEEHHALPQDVGPVFNDGVNLALNLPQLSPSSQNKSHNSLPPPPIRYTERERFFEKRRQMERSPKLINTPPSSLYQRLGDWKLSNDKPGEMTPSRLVQANGSSLFQIEASPTTRDVVDSKSWRQRFR